MQFSPETWGAIIVALLGGGFFQFAYATWKDFRDRPAKPPAEVARFDQNLSAVIRSRDELEEDNRRIRATLGDVRTQANEDRMRYEQERNVWFEERERLRQEITELEKRIRQERIESDQRYDKLLRQVQHIRTNQEIKE